MPKVADLTAALYHEMKDLLSAERQFKTALGKMAASANDPRLKAALAEHQEVTKTQIERLTRAMELLGKKASAKKCEAAAGLVEEGASIMEMEGPESVLDAMLIAAAQKAEHYEIASYGCVVDWATKLGLTEDASLMQTTLDEEKQADKLLSKAAQGLNREATTGQ